jgi:mono/diheme cytochrome c family protein
MKPICLLRRWQGAAATVAVVASLTLLGCYTTQPDYGPLANGPAPLRMPSPARQGACSYEDSLTGGQIFSMYCAQCHNPRPLSERPFAHYQNVAAHMRVRANLTGKEYAKLMEFLRRWHDVPPPTPPDPPSPKRTIFSQPINELRDQKEAPTPPGNPGLPPLAEKAPTDTEPKPPAVVPASAPSPSPRIDDPPPEVPGNKLSQAATLYRQRCQSCHDANGAGASLRASMRSLPDFRDRSWLTGRSDEQLVNSILDGKGSLMPASRGQLSDPQARALVAYIRSLAP